MSSRTDMEKALKKIVVPELRRRGFQGTYPHFRRKVGDRVDLLTVQFSRYADEFILEVGHCGASKVTVLGVERSPEELKVSDLPFQNRRRLMPVLANQVEQINEVWFKFGNCDPLVTAETVLEHLDIGERWLSMNADS